MIMQFKLKVDESMNFRESETIELKEIVTNEIKKEIKKLLV